MRKGTRTCIVCGVEYTYCNSCREHASKPSWMTLYHDDNCRSIMNIATEFMAGNITKADAKSELDKCDLTNKKNFKESIAKAVNEIYGTKKVTKIESAKTVEEIAESTEKI
jgi:hypothetical protein